MAVTYLKILHLRTRIKLADGTEDELIFDSEGLDDINVDQTDKENDIFVDDDYEEVDGFRNIW